jgi:enediyne biosynthesis protein E4
MNIRIHVVETLCMLLLMTATHGCGRTDSVATPPPDAGKVPASPKVVELETSPLQFAECAEAMGVSHIYRNGEERGVFAIVESLGGGVGMLDVDCDGLVDLFVPGGGDFDAAKQPVGIESRLYRQNSRAVSGSFIEISETADVATSTHYSHGSAVSDFDNDGFDDVLVTGYGGVQLFQNHGDGTFTEVGAAVGMSDTLWSSSAAWGDFNGDQANDVYIAHYVDWGPDNDPQCFVADGKTRDICPPRSYAGLPDLVYLSDGAGGFVDAGDQFGDVSPGKGLGVAAADVDVDGDIDVYVTNDTVMNSLLLNDSQREFVESGRSSGTAFGDSGGEDGSMGVDIGDYNGDGLPDIWVTNYENESFALYRNFNGSFFQHVSRSTGISAAGGLSVGWGTVFGDFDLDGDEDLFAANGHVIRHPGNSTILQRPLLLLNEQGRRFRDVANSAGAYLASEHMSRGVAQGDLDHDGDIDLVISNIGQPLAILRNESIRAGNWISLDLIGTETARWAEGARVEFIVENQSTILRLRKGGTSYASTSGRSVHAGLGRCQRIAAIVVHWPSGIMQRFEGVPANQHLTVVEGRAQLIPVTADTAIAE